MNKLYTAQIFKRNISVHSFKNDNEFLNIHKRYINDIKEYRKKYDEKKDLAKKIIYQQKSENVKQISDLVKNIYTAEMDTIKKIIDLLNDDTVQTQTEIKVEIVHTDDEDDDDDQIISGYQQ